MPEPQIVISGNLTSEPELRFTPNGAALASFQIAHNPRYFSDGQWKDGTTVFLPVVVWGENVANNVCQSLRRGSPVSIQGRIRQREWTDKHDQKRRTTEIHADVISVPLTRHTVTMTKVTREKAQTDGDSSGETSEKDPWQAE
jgi:single-strand DNA-binding protein